MYIKIYVSEEEKNRLKALASQRGQTLSALCYERLTPLLHPPLAEVQAPAPPAEEARMDQTVTLHLTSQEYTFLKDLAAGTPLSKYIRRQLLYRREAVSIEVYTEDISILTLKVSGYLERFYSFVAALAIRRQLQEADYSRLLLIAEETKKALRDAAASAKANRNAIRSAGLRMLRAEIKTALEDYKDDCDL